MATPMRRWPCFYKALILFCLAAAGLEAALTLAAPEYRGQWNGRFEDLIYTWGHPVRPNPQGLREREIAVPKPEGVFRALVLGDDSTWGPGLAESERFTALAEARLREAHPERTLEVVSVGMPGASLCELRDALLFWCEVPVNPDLVVVAFGAGALRLEPNESRSEHMEFARRHPTVGLAVPRGLMTLRMPETARLWRRLIARMAEATGSVPSYFEVLARRQAPDAPARGNDAAALNDIRAFCQARGLPPPVFLSLNIVPPESSDDRQQQALGWYEQAERAAMDAGFTVIKGATPRAVPADAWNINLVNGVHPRHLQAAWARALELGLAQALERGVKPDNP